MTDEIQATLSQDQVASPVQSEVSNEVATPQVADAPKEKLLPQSLVDKIVGTRVKEAYAKAKQDAVNEFQTQRQPTTNMGGIEQVAPEQIRQMIQQEAYRMSNEAMASQIVNNFASKMKAGETKYEDFADKMQSLNLSNNPQLVMWTEKLDNAADVLYDMANNPSKVAHILMLANGGFHDLAQMELQKLSSSIKTNEEAKKAPSVNEPLGQLKPSNIGTDNGKMTVSDLRKQPWLYS